MMPYDKKATLFIRRLELTIHLGWTDEERQQEQIVLLDVDITFAKPPQACITDDLQDTLCYATLIAYLRENIEKKNFRLIEHLGFEIFTLIKTHLSLPATVQVHITKHPSIPGLSGGVCFSYGDAV